MKKHNIVKVVLITILVFMLLTWILPAAYFQNTYMEQGRVQMGLFDLFNYSLTTISYFGYIALFVLIVGGFYGILYKIPAYRTFLDKVVAKLEGKETLALYLMMIIIALFTSMTGVHMALIVLFPLLVSIILLMGYDKIVAAMALVGSTMIGLAGTTFGYANSNILVTVLSVKVTDQMLAKVVILVLGLALLITNVYFYIKKSLGGNKKAMKVEKTVVKVAEEKVEDKKVAEKVAPKTTKTAANKTVKSSKTTKSTKSTKSTKTSKAKSSKKGSKNDNKAALKDDDVIVVKKQLDDDVNNGFVPTMVDSTHKIWPFVLCFSLLVVIMILAFIPWSDTFGISAFTDATKAVSEFKLFGFPLFGKLLGTVNAFGSWSITDLFLVLAVVILVLSLIYKIKLDDIMEGFVNGVKKAIKPAIIVVLVYTALVLVTYHPFQLVIYKALLGISKNFNIFTTTIVAMLASLFNSDPSYAFQSVLPYFVSVISDKKVYSIVAVLFQSMYGLSMLVAPTSVILMGVLSFLEVSYKEWLKTIWKLFVEFLVVLLIILTILVLL